VTPAYLAVTILTAAANVFSSGFDFVRHERVLTAMARAGVPESWLTMLGVLKTAGALGLVAGISVPWIGVAAATGLSVFFLAAIGTHLRAHDRAVGLPAAFLLLALASLVLRLS
jgi:hypothetical protein